MSNKEQIVSNTSLLDLYSQCTNYFRVDKRNLLLINSKYFQHKQDRPWTVETKREGMPCTFENILYIKTSV